MLMTELKLQKRISELPSCIYRDMRPIAFFLAKEDTMGVANPPLPSMEANECEKFSLGQKWTGRDRYLWLQTKVTLPEEWSNLPDRMEPVAVFDFGVTGGGCSYGFESMLYLDGVPYQAIDTNHQEVFWKKEHFGKELTLTFRLWSGLEGGGEPREMEHCICNAFLGLLDISVDDFFYTSDTILRTVKLLSDEQPERYELLKALDKAFFLIDWTDKESDAFYETLELANQTLHDEIECMEKHTKVKVSCVGHTHIDTAWLWRLKHTREKAARSFSTVLRFMERYPEYKFLHTQPQQYAFIKEDFPELYTQIQERVKEGRWEIDGAMWVEADCNLTSGESLTRQLLQGRRFMMEEFNKEPQFLWLPDVFGYSATLPQILKKSGIKTFMTTKLAWNLYNHMPNDTFWWKGLDGSKVLTHFITTPIPRHEITRYYLETYRDEYYSTYNGTLFPDTVAGAWKLYRQKDLNQEILLAYGHGDGGGGVTREMLERRRRMERMPGLPQVETTTAGDYFNRLHHTVDNTDTPVATWDDELYLERHRGTYTSQGVIKRLNRKTEDLYRKAEWLTSMAAIGAGEFYKAEQEKLTEGWKILLTQQFHDILPGSSIREVNEETIVNYEEAKRIATEVVEASYGNMTTHDVDDNTHGKIYSILNTAAEDRCGLVKITDDVLHFSDKTLCTLNGKEVFLQKGIDGVWAYVEDVPSMGIQYLYEKESKCFQDENRVSTIDEGQEGTWRILTSYYEVELNKEGQIALLYDRHNDCQILEESNCGNVLQLFEDKPIDLDAWEIDIFYYQKMKEVTNLVNREIVENGPLRTVIRQEWDINKSHICQDMILYAHDGRIDFKTHIAWDETQKLLKVAFPVDIRSTYATYDIQYGNIRRTNTFNTSWDRAKYEVVGQRWADLSEYGYGVSLLNDCKYGYDIHQNVMRLSLLKSSIYPDYAADKGEHDFTYSLYPHKGDFVEGRTVQTAFDLNQPMEVINGKVTLPTGKGASTIRISGVNVELDACKKSEDGKYLVLRFHEYSGAKGNATIQFGFPVEQVCECDLMERPIETFYRTEENCLKVKVRPYEIKTFLLKV